MAAQLREYVRRSAEDSRTDVLAGSGAFNGNRLEVLWLTSEPGQLDKFLTWGADLTLYEVAALEDVIGRPSCIKLSQRWGAVAIASHSNQQNVKCVDVSRVVGRDGDREEPLLALGHNSGKVVLTSFGHGDSLPFGAGGMELIPRHPRSCNSVAWNPTEAGVLAAALDKYRNDHCILLYDINKCTSAETGSSSPRLSGMSSSWHGPVSGVTAGVELPRPIAEMGLSETAHALAWTHSSYRLLLASMNQKNIKIFDLRDFSNKAVTVCHTKFCYGVCADPFNEWQMASRADSTVCVWDYRLPDRPLLTLPQSKPVTKILWCPTRRNLIGSIQRDSCTIRLHDLQLVNDTQTSLENAYAQYAEAGGAGEGGNGGEAVETGPCVVERNVSPGSCHSITGFSWHPSHQARLLAIALSGTIMDYTVCERVTVGWGAGSGQLVWSQGGSILYSPTSDLYDSLQDISGVMKQRATTDYGLCAELLANGDLAKDASLKNLWSWLHRSKSLVEEGCIRGTQWRHPGVRSALKLEPGGATGGGGYRSETVASLTADFGNLHNTTYKSAERTRALQLCGWGWESVSVALDKMEGEGAVSRAAAIAVFHLRFRVALDILGRAQDNSLRVVALALAGYSDERGMWRDLAATLATSKLALQDPYIRAIFAFLTADDPDYKGVLSETEILLEDRVAFACMFLDDGRLAEYVRALTAALTERGELDGILLTGMSTEGIALLQRWLEATADVQSAALLAARTFTVDMMRDHRVANWIASYRWLLDSWRLWWSRCALDTWSGGAACGAQAARPSQQVYISCGFCGKTVSSPHGLARPRTFARIAPAPNKMKQISACPNCRKPLPRCSVCLLHMGTAAGTGGGGVCATGAGFPGWFTWCVACRHGGHAKHLLQWFEEHAECPVSSCTCRCLNMDLPVQLQ